MTIRSSAVTIVASVALLLVVSCGTADPVPTPGGPSSGSPTTDLAETPSLSVALDSEAAARGRAIAIVGCASCHAIDAAGDSPFAAAPAFRDVARSRSLDDLETAFAQGLVTTHPAMPPYVFRASEIDDLIAYFEAFQTLPDPSSLDEGR